MKHIVKPYDPEVAQAWQTMEIPIHFHVIRGNEQGSVAKEHVEMQLKVLNRAFADGRIAFVERSLEYININDWFRMGLGSDAEWENKKAYSKETRTCLNFYVSNLLGTGAHGYARQPWEFKYFNHILDGVVVHYGTLPGLPRKKRNGEVNKGSVGVHEVGHWFGLHHTYEGYGVPPGDAVDDTPRQHAPSRRRAAPGTDRSQPYPEEEPCANYMDKASDDCRNYFTPGQFFRIREDVLPLYKKWLLP